MKLTKETIRQLIKEEIEKVLVEKIGYQAEQKLGNLLDKFDRADTKKDKASFFKEIEKITSYPKDVSNRELQSRYIQAKNIMARMTDSEAPKDNVDRYFDRYKGTGNLPY